MAEDRAKTGTTTVVIMCKDGVVLAADKRTTAGGMIVYKKAKKVVPITDKIAVTTAGTVSDIQLLVKLIKAELQLKDIQTSRVSTVEESANLLAGMLYSTFRRPSMVMSIAAFMIAGKDNTGFHAYELGYDGSLIDIDEYASDGSGSVFALGVLETLYKKNMGVEDGIKLAVKAINAALQRDTGSGNGIDVVTITDKGLQWVLEKELDTRIEA